MRRWGSLFLCVCFGLLVAGCPKGNDDFKQGRRAEALQDYDSALEHYQKALKSDPLNVEYKLKNNQIHFDAAQFHVRQGQKARDKGDLQLAIGEFQRASVIDPASAIAEQELKTTLDLLTAREKSAEAAAAPLQPEKTDRPLASEPPELKPLSHAPINLKASNDARIIYETLGKLAGLTVIFDPDFPSRRITTELTNVTLEQALDIVSLQSKAFWKPVTENIILVVPDQPQKRRDYEEQLVKTFYLSNTVQPQDLTEIVTGLRQLLNLTKVQQLNAQNAIIIRDTADKLALAEKIIRDVDKAKPEVVIQVEVLQVRLDHVRNLGILPGSSAAIAYAPGGAATSGTSTSSLSLNQLKHLSSRDYAVTLPGATVTALLTDNQTRIIQNPELRATDGQPAKLTIGDRVPIATGSFQAGVGVGATGVNPLVNTQFQYIDTGVVMNITPRVHPNREVSMKLSMEVSSVTGHQSIGGIDQPVISSRKIEHDIRLKEGEVNILGGMIDRTNTKALKGWPGFASVPLLNWITAEHDSEVQENEILIVLIPRIVRMPVWTKDNLRSLSSGTETNIQVRRESDIQTPAAQPLAPQQQQPQSPQMPAPGMAPAIGTQPARLRFEPQTQAIKTGETVTLGVVVENVNDLFSVPLLLQYNPAVISVEEVRLGGFLSGGTQEIAIVQRVDKEHGQAIVSATRQPNTPGVSGSGTLMGIVVRGLAPGTSSLSIVQVNARDSQQKVIPLVTGEAALTVGP